MVELILEPLSASSALESCSSSLTLKFSRTFNCASARVLNERIWSLPELPALNWLFKVSYRVRNSPENESHSGKPTAFSSLAIPSSAVA